MKSWINMTKRPVVEKVLIIPKIVAENIKPLLLKIKDSMKSSKLRTICRTPGSQKYLDFLTSQSQIH